MDLTDNLTPVVTIGLNRNSNSFDYSMTELNNLVEANNMKVVESLVQKLDKPDPATYFGKGKIEELTQVVIDDGVNTIVANDELSPSQIRNIEKNTKARIIDRTGLILEIFANRAQSREAKLQVELAKLKYQLPRLHTSASQRLDQQTGTSSGGGFTNRGAGESQYELNRRTLEKRITHVNAELKESSKADLTKRKQRDRSETPTVALVGYTNAGKSTVMNGMINLYGENEDKQVMVKNMLFATLDTSVRKLTLPDQKRFLLSDTVGFVSQLPHQLVQAFKSTLAEAASADLLIQVVDYSDPHRELMMKTTEETLAEIGITNVPMIVALNKADKLEVQYPNREGDNLIMSANDEDSLKELTTMIKEKIFKDYQTLSLLIPFDKGDVVSYLNDNTNILKTDYRDDGTVIKAELKDVDAKRFAKYVLTTD
ncbi:MAG: GTPase HflX [Lactobacillus sp.]|uniref:GTPase HflX n=2 Tax=Lentilactobacillus diolivorans TaxID=179838 RepID=A0A0R1SAI5_9LACO|nr:GTPase HflX [Lentilactobacillus diolivorans]KRL65438.1 GTP-binding protein HflX [Lentilactobacillus diolivorans DSM 14421]RRG03390.1 MAG: GTPase HflX [Lactobacillus sp.]GEP23175.1 GTPase HflX [Lentilactobacillus diolivorans]